MPLYSNVSEEHKSKAAMGFVRQAVIYFSGVKTLNYEPVAQYFANDRWKIVAQSFQNFTSIFANLVADLMLIHRCYIVWNSRKEVALPLLFLSFGTNVVGLAGSILESLGLQDSTNDANFALYERGAEVLAGYSITATVISSLLTLLTAGRIWYITHEARSMMGGQVRKRYNTLIAVMLESGIIYPTLMIIHLVLSNTTMDINGYGSVVLYPVGIAPTLIIVRVGLGKSVEPVYGDGEGGPSAVSTLRFAESGLGTTGMAQRASFK
ncbi:hypothetical protein Moror_9233 [Moniliophthora roreri MCA 2997]|uniref:Uncharacterized protein n=1 Tax=Moniliophthora roreri (strain MCA 2997) TaxID=1381753 RepID=V2WWN0_MONRO|nr:hypothetical protein Moror_9233 [Moniliophthora roreri MCA 2997]